MESQTHSFQSPSEGGKVKMYKKWQESLFQQIGEKDTDLRVFTKTKKGRKFSAYAKSTSYKSVIHQSKEHLRLVSCKDSSTVQFKQRNEQLKPKDTVINIYSLLLQKK